MESNLFFWLTYVLFSTAVCLTLALNFQIIWRKKMEFETKKQSEFIADIAHRLKTPLTFIFLNVDLAKRYLADQDFSLVEKSLFSARQAIANLNRITSNLIVLGKINYGLVNLKKAKFNLSHSIQTAVGEFQILAGERKLITKIEPDIYFYGDESKFEETILNLLDNSLKFTHPKTGRIVTSLYQKDGKIILKISDNGSGIKAKDLPHLFKRYYQAKNHSACAGIGLTIVKWVVKGHRGNIEVESKEKKGAKFIITLPKQ